LNSGLRLVLMLAAIFTPRNHELTKLNYLSRKPGVLYPIVSALPRQENQPRQGVLSPNRRNLSNTRYSNRSARVPALTNIAGTKHLNRERLKFYKAFPINLKLLSKNWYSAKPSKRCC